MHRLGIRLALIAIVAGFSAGCAEDTTGPALADVSVQASTVVPGHQRDKNDLDGNGIPDVGVVVNGHYKQTLGGCDYVVNYRGRFDNTPYMDSGWIQNHITCADGTYNYLFVHQTDPRYRGDPAWAIWGTWEWKILAASGEGNLVKIRPVNHGG